MADTHVCIKRFGGPEGAQFVPGQTVDASDWPHTDKLTEHRYIKPLPQVAVESTEEGERILTATGRRGRR